MEPVVKQDGSVVPVKHEEDQVAIKHYFLRPQGSELEPEPLDPRKFITVFSQKEGKVAQLMSKYASEKGIQQCRRAAVQ